MAIQIQLRHDTAANWASANPTLALGELGLDTTNNLYKMGNGATAWNSLAYYGPPTRSISYVIDGGGTVPATGAYGQLNIPVACTVTGWVLTGDVAGACVVDVLRSTYANFPTTASIAGTDKPTIAATNQKAENLTISAWGSTALVAGDQLQFSLSSVTTITRINITLIVTVP